MQYVATQVLCKAVAYQVEKGQRETSVSMGLSSFPISLEKEAVDSWDVVWCGTSHQNVSSLVKESKRRGKKRRLCLCGIHSAMQL